MTILENKLKPNKSIFFISPVNGITKKDLIKCEKHVSEMKADGREIHFPLKDTKQTGDSIGYRICTDNKNALNNANGVHLYLAEGTKGSFFDIGMTLIKNKQLYIVNPEMFNLDDEVEKAIIEYSMLDIERNTYTTSKLFYELNDYRQEIIESKKDLSLEFKYDREHLLKLGMLFNSEKPFYISNINEIEKTPTKSFQNVIHEINRLYEQNNK